MATATLSRDEAADLLLQELRLGQEASEQDRERERASARYGRDPATFALECIDWGEGEGLADYQLEILEEFTTRRRVAVRGPHGLGKTALAAILVLWFANTRDGRIDWKNPTTASAWRQLTHFLWPEIRKWASKLRWDKLGREAYDNTKEMLKLSLSLETGEAFAIASDRPVLMEGAHASELLYIFDESKAIPAETFDAVEGAFSSGECYALAISTPGEPQGRFYEIHSRKPGFEDWWVRHVTLEECIAAGRVSAAWAEQRKLQWGEESAVYQNRVLGEFASSEEGGVIPLSWVEAANERWRALHDSGQWGDFTRCGVDVARSGADKTVIAMRHGGAIRELRRFSKDDTMVTTGRVAGILREHGGEAAVDVIGIGAGVVDRLREDRDFRRRTMAFNASEKTEAVDCSGELGFINKRSASWWHLRELLDPANDTPIALPPDDLLIGDLTAPHWKLNSGGRIQVESKDAIKKRLGRSTDDGDAVCMAFWSDPDTPQRPLTFGKSIRQLGPPGGPEDEPTGGRDNPMVSRRGPAGRSSLQF